MWTLHNFNAAKAKNFELETRKQENHGLQVHLDQRAEQARNAAVKQTRCGNTEEWRGFDAGLNATHRGAAGNFIPCDGKYAHLKHLAKNKRKQRTGSTDQSSDKVLLCGLACGPISATVLMFARVGGVLPM